jgi:7,8-dihydropterin-6-yl-methyl-4-(beta-D-ribofuranosyl)aminobenzene 5'-phosphate synthase
MADRLEITLLVDNYVDIFLPSAERVTYPSPGGGSRLWGEQGLSIWLKVGEAGKTLRILYDFGRTDRVLFHNAEQLGIDIGTADFMVLSHAHGDHYGGLNKALRKAQESCRLVVHPAACGIKRFIRFGESTVGPWGIKKSLLKEFQSRVLLSDGLTALGHGVHVSGEIERQAPFEKGMPNAFLEKDGELVRDKIADDQALFVELGHKRLVVITGCAHAGVVNTILHAERLFPGYSIFAVLGGFHLNNADGEQMNETVKCLRRTDVKYIAGVHCTGYYAQKFLMDQFTDRWIPGAVGARITFNGNGA